MGGDRPGRVRLLQHINGEQQSLAKQVVHLDTEAGGTGPELVTEVATEQTQLKHQGKGLSGHAEILPSNPASDNCQLCDSGQMP